MLVKEEKGVVSLVLTMEERGRLRSALLGDGAPRRYRYTLDYSDFPEREDLEVRRRRLLVELGSSWRLEIEASCEDEARRLAREFLKNDFYADVVRIEAPDGTRLYWRF